jgi:nucleoside-diphosphate-sugar epimerase
MTDRMVLVTGGAGFLGEHVARSLLASGSRVRVFDQAPSPAWAGLAGLEFIHGDVRDQAALLRAAAGASAIVHAAFASPRQATSVITSVNIQGTENVRAAAVANGVGRIVLVSSTVAGWDPRPHPFLRHSPLGRLDLYRATRTEAEALLTQAAPASFTTAVVRPQSFLGPGRLGAFGIIFELIRAGEPVPVLGSGGHRYQMLGVQDLAEGLTLLTAAEHRGIFSFGASTFGTVREDLGALLSHAGTRATLLHIPSAFARPALRAIELAGLVPLSEWHRHGAWAQDSVADTTRARRELGWQPERSNIDALIEAYDWYVETVGRTGNAPRTHPVPRAHRVLRGLLGLLPHA